MREGRSRIMRAQIIEHFCEGKFCDARNEDRVFISDRHIAVIDGSSASQPIGGRAGGIVAAETIAGVLALLPVDATIHHFTVAASEALAAVTRQAGALESPYAAAVVLSLDRSEIWRIGDCPFAIDGHWNIPEHNPHERTFFRFRQMMLSGSRHILGRGLPSADEHLGAITRDWLTMTKGWVNSATDDFAFAALDAHPPPPHFLEIFPVPPGTRSIVLASDGAVVSAEGQRGPSSVADMTAQISAAKSADSSCLHAFPYWRGFLDGSQFLDDTTFLALSLTA